MAVDVGYWPLYRYTPETDLPSTTDEVSCAGLLKAALQSAASWHNPYP